MNRTASIRKRSKEHTREGKKIREKITSWKAAGGTNSYAEAGFR